MDKKDFFEDVNKENKKITEPSVKAGGFLFHRKVPPMNLIKQ